MEPAQLHGVCCKPEVLEDCNEDMQHQSVRQMTGAPEIQASLLEADCQRRLVQRHLSLHYRTGMRRDGVNVQVQIEHQQAVAGTMANAHSVAVHLQRLPSSVQSTLATTRNPQSAALHFTLSAPWWQRRQASASASAWQPAPPPVRPAARCFQQPAALPPPAPSRGPSDPRAS